MGKEVKLIMVTVDNNNKYYNMQENGDGTFTVTYGRVEKTAMTKNYPMSAWDKTYRSKTKKGYKDVTELYIEEAKADTGANIGEIQNRVVKRLMDELQAFANNSIVENYSVSSQKVTQVMVDRAQEIIDDLKKKIKIGAKKDDLNKTLLDLYRVIPRQMSKVQHHLFKSDIYNQQDINDAGEKMKEEQDLLDVMAGQVIINDASAETDNGKPVENILELLGLEVEEADQNDIALIKDLMGSSKNKMKKVFRANNIETRKTYEKYLAADKNAKVELFWHGSRNQNWLNIMKTGLLIRPSGAIHTGSMFGDGIYFADKAQKSIGYSSLRGSYWTGGSANKGYLALYEVNVGKQKKIKHHNSSCYTLSKKKLEKEGYNSVFALGGADLRNNEYIIYESERCTLKYLVEIGN